MAPSGAVVAGAEDENAHMHLLSGRAHPVWVLRAADILQPTPTRLWRVDERLARSQTEYAMTAPTDEKSAEFQRGWDAAILAARSWHEGKAKQALVLSRRSRFPKNLERESEVHKHSAEMMMTLSPDDV